MTEKIVPSLADVKYQRLAAQAERETFMNSVLKASYVKWDDVKITWDAIQAVQKNYLMGIPALVVPLVIGKEDKDEMIRIMREFIWNYLNDVDKLEPEIILLRNKRMTKYQQRVKENNTANLPTAARVKI